MSQTNTLAHLVSQIQRLTKPNPAAACTTAGDGDIEREGGNEDPKEEADSNDLERGGVGLQSNNAIVTDPPGQFHMSRMQILSATNPPRLVINGATRVPTASPSQPRATPSPDQPLSTPPLVLIFEILIWIFFLRFD
ncbi:Zinc finger protein [Actinidia chinensis var. chinensis]|uniref:Zinc finger protein n=1 Tax=Actinidia chinensis var. chinensis TaxID=1590841 RepID=A0A2R6QQ31_ACTCC|nr:Zinc finger protein [Actinidia chinensis var. chinensis]